MPHDIVKCFREHQHEIALPIHAELFRDIVCIEVQLVRHVAQHARRDFPQVYAQVTVTVGVRLNEPRDVAHRVHRLA